MARKQISSGLKYQIIANNESKCAYCGKKLEIAYMKNGKPYLSFGKGNCKFHFDHIIPVKLGGKNTIENLVLTCTKCNLSKGIKSREDFILLLIKKGIIK